MLCVFFFKKERVRPIHRLDPKKSIQNYFDLNLISQEKTDNPCPLFGTGETDSVFI